MNRWTGALRIPQEEHRVYLTPTSEKYRDAHEPAGPAGSRGAARPVGSAPGPRGAPPLESRARGRGGAGGAAGPASRGSPWWTSRGPGTRRGRLVGRARCRSGFGCWRRSPRPARRRVAMHRASETKGLLAPRLAGPRSPGSRRGTTGAWYALGHARKRLDGSGQGDDAIFALDRADSGRFTPAQRGRVLARQEADRRPGRWSKTPTSPPCASISPTRRSPRSCSRSPRPPTSTGSPRRRAFDWKSTRRPPR